MFKHKQFDSNYLTKHIFSRKYIFGLLFLGTVKPFQYSNTSSVHIVNPHFTATSGLKSNQYMINTKYTNFTPHQPWSSHGLLHFISKFYINSIPRFETDQTAPNGLNRLKHSKSTKNGNKTQVGRKSYLLEFVKNSQTRSPRIACST